MHGRDKSHHRLKIVIITPEEATAMLEANTINRPLNQAHINRITRQILDGEWVFNGDTIKLSTKRDVLDGQHRLWACVEAKIPIETIVVDNIEPKAFSKIDTLRKPRSGSDVLAVAGVERHRSTISVALQWLVRWQRGVIVDFQLARNRVENSDIENAYKDNPGIARSAERCNKLRGLMAPGIMAFLYYTVSNRNQELAERMMSTMESPGAVGLTDPFFRFRCYVAQPGQRRDAVMTLALAIKAANAASEGRELKGLSWRSQGSFPEEFPKLIVAQTDKGLR